MKNLTKFVMLGLLLVPFAAVINTGNAFGETVEVTISPGSASAGCEATNSCWEPSTVEVSAGTTVKWVNKDAAGHTVTSGVPGGAGFGEQFDSTKDPAGFLIQPEKSWEHTFDTEGEFPFFCQVHPWMIGEVIVGGGMEGEEEEEAEGEMPEEDKLTLRLPTDNGSTTVQVRTDKGMLHGSEFMIDPPSEVTFSLTFLDSSTGKPLEHVNYQFHVADASGAMVAHEMGQHSMGGVESKSVAFSNTGSYTVTVVVEGTGASQPYDTSHSGTASTMIAVTPEFPLGIMAIMAAVVGIGIAASRFKSPFKL